LSKSLYVAAQRTSAQAARSLLAYLVLAIFTSVGATLFFVYSDYWWVGAIWAGAGLVDVGLVYMRAKLIFQWGRLQRTAALIVEGTFWTDG